MASESAPEICIVGGSVEDVGADVSLGGAVGSGTVVGGADAGDVGVVDVGIGVSGNPTVRLSEVVGLTFSTSPPAGADAHPTTSPVTINHPSFARRMDRRSLPGAERITDEPRR